MAAPTHIGGASNSGLASSTTIAETYNITAGNLAVVHVAWEDINTACTVSDGTSSFTAGTLAANGDNTNHSQFFYLLSANGGNKTFTATFGTSSPYRSIHISEFNAAGTWILDAQNIGTGNGYGLTSGSIDTSGSSAVVLGGFKHYSSGSYSGELIGGVTPTIPSYTPPTSFDFSKIAYRLLDATISSATAYALRSVTDTWACNIIAFKATEAGGIALPVITNQFRQRRA